MGETGYLGNHWKYVDKVNMMSELARSLSISRDKNGIITLYGTATIAMET